MSSGDFHRDRTTEINHLGKARTFCDGRCITGPESSGVAGTFGLILIPSVFYYAFVLPRLIELQITAFAVIPVFTLPLTMVLLIVASCTDPGIIPKQKSVASTTSIFDESAPVAVKTVKVLVDGQQVDITVKWCHTCHFYRPDRASHCSTCDNCVHNFDHHCPWISNCVGRNNYRVFVWFVNSVILNCLWILIASLVAVILTTIRDPVSKNQTGFDALGAAIGVHGGSIIVSIILCVYTFGVMWCMWGLCSYHLYLSLRHETTHERMYGKYSKQGELNPRDRGIV